MNETLLSAYPWISFPLIVAAPMMKISTAPLAVAASKAHSLGFLAGGFDLSSLDKDLEHTAKLIKSSSISLKDGLLPIGIGFQNWGSDLQVALSAIKKHPPVAVWFFAPGKLVDLAEWAIQVRGVTNNKTKI